MKLCYILTVIILALIATPVSAQWWDEDFGSRREILITNQNTSRVLPSGYTITLGIPLANLSGSYADPFDNIRMVTNLSGTPVELTRVIEDTPAGINLSFKLIENVTAGSNTRDYWIYYNNITEVSAAPSDYMGVYLFGDDFEDGSINTSIWNIVEAAGATISETPYGTLQINGDGNWFGTRAESLNITPTIDRSQIGIDIYYRINKPDGTSPTATPGAEVGYHDASPATSNWDVSVQFKNDETFVRADAANNGGAPGWGGNVSARVLLFEMGGVIGIAYSDLNSTSVTRSLTSTTWVDNEDLIELSVVDASPNASFFDVRARYWIGDPPNSSFQAEDTLPSPPDVVLLSPPVIVGPNDINLNVSVTDASTATGLVQLNGVNQTLTNISGNFGYVAPSLAFGTYTAQFYINDSQSSMNDSVKATFTVTNTTPVSFDVGVQAHDEDTSAQVTINLTVSNLSESHRYQGITIFNWSTDLYDDFVKVRLANATGWTDTQIDTLKWLNDSTISAAVPANSSLYITTGQQLNLTSEIRGAAVGTADVAANITSTIPVTNYTKFDIVSTNSVVGAASTDTRFTVSMGGVAFIDLLHTTQTTETNQLAGTWEIIRHNISTWNVTKAGSFNKSVVFSGTAPITFTSRTTTTDGSSHAEMIIDNVHIDRGPHFPIGAVTFTASAPGYVDRSQAVTLDPNSQTYIDFLMLQSADAGNKRVRVFDIVSLNAIEGASVNVYKFIGGGFVLVGSGTTDSLGIARFELDDTSTYQINVSAGGYESRSIETTPDQDDIFIGLQKPGGLGDYWENIVSGLCQDNNVSDNLIVNCTFATNGTSAQFTLKVIQSNTTAQATLCSNSTTGSNGTLYCFLGNQSGLGGRYDLSARVGLTTLLLDTGFYDYGFFQVALGLAGVFASFILVSSLGLGGFIVRPSLGVIMTVLGFMLSVFLSLIIVGWPYVVGLTVVGAFIAWRLES